MEMKKTATLEPLEECRRRESGRLEKQGRPFRMPQRVIKWEWGEKQQQALEQVKKSILENGIFGENEHLQYHFATDASKTGLGGVLF
jgi:hypothetical protein